MAKRLISPRKSLFSVNLIRLFFQLGSNIFEHPGVGFAARAFRKVPAVASAITEKLSVLRHAAKTRAAR
jgi:hypothetical protein